MQNHPSETGGHIDFNRTPEVSVQPDGALQETLADTREKAWFTTTLYSIEDVRDFLDSLEAHSVETREVSVVNDTTFAIRWR
jgi:hypothetical protein